MTYLKDLGLGKVEVNHPVTSCLMLLLGVSVREEEKCQSFQESLRNDMAATRHASQLDMKEVDYFVSQLVDCEGQLFVSGVGESISLCACPLVLHLCMLFLLV